MGHGHLAAAFFVIVLTATSRSATTVRFDIVPRPGGAAIGITARW